MPHTLQPLIAQPIYSFLQTYFVMSQFFIINFIHANEAVQNQHSNGKISIH